MMMHELDPRTPPLYVDMFAALEDRRLGGVMLRLEEDLRRLSRWRWLRRFHLERQLIVMRFAMACYAAGATRAIRTHGYRAAR